MKALLFLGALCLPQQSESKDPPKPTNKPTDPSKVLIENPTKALISRLAPADDRTPLTTVPANPIVSPGKVRWHKDYTAACEASARSGKPVLLFHLLGKLDERFT